MNTERPLQHTPDQNLQTLLGRYSLVGEGDDYFTEYMHSPESPRQLGQRIGYLYGELTSKGLVHVWADPEKSDYANAEVLIIDHSFVSTYTHVYTLARDSKLIMSELSLGLTLS